MKTGKTARDEKVSTIVDRSCVSCGEKPQEGKTHDAFFAAPHFRLSAEYGGAPDLIIRAMGLSYAAVVKLIGDENLSTSRKTAKIVQTRKREPPKRWEVILHLATNPSPVFEQSHSRSSRQSNLLTIYFPPPSMTFRTATWQLPTRKQTTWRMLSKL